MPTKKTTKTRKTVEKGIQQAVFTPATAENALSVLGMQSLSQSLTPQQAYELSIDVRAAVQAIATNISKAKIRLFSRRTGDEIIGGPLFDLLRAPAPGYTMSSFLNEVISWWNIAGEFAISMLPGKKGIAGMIPLSPFSLDIAPDNNPQMPKNLAEVHSWQYRWNHETVVMLPAEQVIFDKNFNPYSLVRGLSPLVTGVNEVSSSYYATRYNKGFFERNAVPSHLLVLPSGTPKSQRNDFEQRYLEQYTGYSNGSHKVMVVSGDEVKFQALEQPFSEGAFRGLQEWNTAKIAQLYKVPASIMGIYDKSRFETAGIERKLFLEDTLLPQMNRLSEALQVQLVDRYYPFSDTTKRTPQKEVRMGTQMQKAFTRAMDERTTSDIIILIDPDTLPVMAEIKLDMVAVAEKLQTSLRMSANEAAEFVGLDIPYSELRDKIFIPNNLTELTDKPAPEAAPTIPPVEDTAEADDAPADQPQKAMSAEQKAEAKKIKRCLDEIRKHTLNCVDSGRLFKLSEADALISEMVNGSEALRLAVRKDYFELKSLLRDKSEQEERARIVKDYFNGRHTRQFIKSLVV